ncbi:MAG: hypothetical protein KGJ13_08260, partial [Patescibacteria group bacterium]|nr:hypothetical protein [Patescibacteria group bacterium]
KLGDVLTVAGAGFVALSIFYKRGNLDGAAQEILKQLIEDLKEMKMEFSEFRKTITDVASQKVQIEFLLKAYDDLRRGVGKIGH